MIDYMLAGLELSSAGINNATPNAIATQTKLIANRKELLSPTTVDCRHEGTRSNRSVEGWRWGSICHDCLKSVATQ